MGDMVASYLVYIVCLPVYLVPARKTILIEILPDSIFLIPAACCSLLFPPEHPKIVGGTATC